MLEGRPLQAPETRDSSQADELRPLTWGDLRSRLEAARDLRATMLAAADEPHASFESFSATRVGTQEDGKQAVNPDDLANGKGLSGNHVRDEQSGTGSDPRE